MSKRFLFLLAAWCGLALFPSMVAGGQEQAGGKRPAEETETRNEPDFKWHLVNTALFAGLVLFAYSKLAPGFFNARSADIQKAIKDATGLKIEADFRSSEIDRRMATLPDEVKRIRELAKIELEREHARRQAETQQQLKQIQSSLQGEISGLRAESAHQIRQAAARMAFRQAESRLRDRAVQGGDTDLTGEFVQLVEQGRTV